MPVDLSAIPPVAKRKKCPALKRWLLTLLVILLCGGLITLKLWPAEQATRGALFWHSLISIPVIIWLVALGIRWLIWLVSEWQADGWDSERAADITAEVQRGQRFLVIEAVSICLPHAAAKEALAEQFQLDQAVVLPVVVNEDTLSVSRLARFKDLGQPMIDRAFTLLISLLEETKLNEALAQGTRSVKISTVIQIDTDTDVSADDLLVLKDRIENSYPAQLSFDVDPQFSLEDIDKYLDEKPGMDELLILSIRLLHSPADGDAEVGVALLVSGMKNDLNLENKRARLHRPEFTRNEVTMRQSVEQALQWGGEQPDSITHLWLAGLGVENKALTFLANNQLKFSQIDAKGSFIDIDMKSGRTGKVSPWLAIALAAENSEKEPAPQLVMSMPDAGDLPWWLIVHPA